MLLLEGLEADLIMFSAGISACPGNPANEADWKNAPGNVVENRNNVVGFFFLNSCPFEMWDVYIEYTFDE